MFPLPIQVVKKRKISHDHEVRSSSKPLSKKDANKLSAARSGSRSASKKKRRRSPSLTSIDSFAEAEEWEDHARVFLASNPRFEVPLSELGRGTTQKESHVRHHTVNGMPLSPDPTQAVLRHSSPTKGVSADDSEAVEAQRPMVPSDGALSQVANVSIDAQERSPSPISDIPGDIPTPMMSNSSSIDPYSVDRAEDYQATQPLSSEDLDRNSTQVFDAIDSHSRQTSPPAWGSMASRPSTNARNILSMVNPQKQWRLRRGEKLLQAALQSGSDGQTQPPANASGSSHAQSTGRRLFDHLAAQVRAGQQSSPRCGLEGQNEPHSSASNGDGRETAVVPDSEPPDASNMSSTSVRPRSSMPEKASVHVDSSLSCPVPVPSIAIDQNDKEKDSQIEDDEEDIPLLFTLGHPAKGAPSSPSKARNPPKVLYHSSSPISSLLTIISSQRPNPVRHLFPNLLNDTIVLLQFLQLRRALPLVGKAKNAKITGRMLSRSVQDLTKRAPLPMGTRQSQQMTYPWISRTMRLPHKARRYHQNVDSFLPFPLRKPRTDQDLERQVIRRQWFRVVVPQKRSRPIILRRHAFSLCGSKMRRISLA
jgi:hypothetical protein